MTEEKKRHGCLTVYLVFMIVVNFLTAAGYFFAGDKVTEVLPNMKSWVLIALGIAAVINIVFAIALLKLKKWAFWGFCGISIVVFGINLASGIGVASSIMGLLGIAILFGVLQIGGENKGWAQLD